MEPAECPGVAKTWSPITWSDDGEGNETRDQADFDEAWIRWARQCPEGVPPGKRWLPHVGDCTEIPRASCHLPEPPEEVPEARDPLEEYGAEQGSAGAGRTPLP